MTIPATQPQILPPITDPTVHAALDRLARDYVAAGGAGLEILNAIGGGAEVALRRLPEPVRVRIDRITRVALEQALGMASASRLVVRDRSDRFNRLASSLSGAVGGAAGMAGAVIELPVTVTMLMRAIMAIAAEHGYDTSRDETRIEALHVFAAAGPLSDDDGADLGLLAARLSLSGQSVQMLIARVAPRVAAMLSEKLAAQAVPVLGAVAGATINYSFAGYYQRIARVHFGMLRLSDESGLPREALVEALGERVAALKRAGHRRG